VAMFRSQRRYVRFFPQLTSLISPIAGAAFAEAPVVEATRVEVQFYRSSTLELWYGVGVGRWTRPSYILLPIMPLSLFLGNGERTGDFLFLSISICG